MYVFGGAGENEPDTLVEVFADKIPHTHGVPVRVAAMAQLY